MAKDYDKEDGVWRTIGGRKVFIRKGQNLADAMIESGKFKGQKNKKGARESYREEKEKDIKEQQDLLNEVEKDYSEENNKKYLNKIQENQEKYVKSPDEQRKDKEKEIELGKAEPVREKYRENPYRKESLEREKNLENAKEEERRNLFREAYDKLDKKDYNDLVERSSREEISNEEVRAILKHNERVKGQADERLNKELTKDDESVEELDRKYNEAHKQMKSKSTNEKFGYNDARDILNQLNSEGSDFTFGEIETDKYKYNQDYKEAGKLKTEVSVFMPDERGYTTRELEIPIDKNETRASFEEKLRDWQSRHSSPDTWEDEDFKSTNETMNQAIREKANGIKLLKARKNEIGTETEDLINTYNQYAKEGRGNADTYKSLKKQIAENRKATKQKSTPNYDSYSADEQDILDGFGEDYGWDNPNKLQNLKEQIDYMRNPGESIRQAARRYATGGSGTMLIYTGDAEDYLKERGIKYNKDDPFSKYADVMAEKIEKLYNDASNDSMNNAIRKQANIKNAYKQYMKDHPESKMSLSQFKKMNK